MGSGKLSIKIGGAEYHVFYYLLREKYYCEDAAEYVKEEGIEKDWPKLWLAKKDGKLIALELFGGAIDDHSYFLLQRSKIKIWDKDKPISAHAMIKALRYLGYQYKSRIVLNDSQSVKKAASALLEDFKKHHNNSIAYIRKTYAPIKKNLIEESDVNVIVKNFPASVHLVPVVEHIPDLDGIYQGPIQQGMIEDFCSFKLTIDLDNNVTAIMSIDYAEDGENDPWHEEVKFTGSFDFGRFLNLRYFNPDPVKLQNGVIHLAFLNKHKTLKGEFIGYFYNVPNSRGDRGECKGTLLLKKSQ